MSHASASSTWSLRQVQHTLGLSRHTLTGLIVQKFVRPQRGPRNELRFSFQDLVLLRTAFELRRSRIPPRTILLALASLRDELPPALPLTGLRITADGANVVVRNAGHPRNAITGQLVMDFELVTAEDGSLAVLHVPPGQLDGPDAQAARAQWERGDALEAEDRSGAIQAYRQAIALDPTLLAAYVSLGALLCEVGACAEAAAVCDQALENGLADAYLHFNHAIALEDSGQPQAAIASYGAALLLDPNFADAHFNLARLLQDAGDGKGALRHWSACRRLEREMER